MSAYELTFFLFFFVFLLYRVNATVIRLGKRRSAGYGFVTFETAQEAEKAVEKFNKTELDEREITVQIARPKAPKSPTTTTTTKKDTTTEGEPTTKADDDDAEGAASKPRRRRRSLVARRPTTASTTRIFVANLPYATTEDELTALFDGFSISSSTIARLRK